MITCLNDLLTREIINGDDIIFNVGEQPVKGTVYDRYINFTVVNNDYIFNILNIEEPYKFCEKYYGYQPNKGCWPECHSEDFQALQRLLIAIFEIIEGKASVQPKLKYKTIYLRG
jgi:hypothetical protein